MLGTIEVHAGDFVKGKHGQFVARQFLLKAPGRFTRETLPVSAVTGIEVATEESARRFWPAVGRGLAGGLLLGGVGALAGVLAGGSRKRVTFICEFEDGRRFLGTTDSKTWIAITAARFDAEAAATRRASAGASADPAEPRRMGCGRLLLGTLLLSVVVSVIFEMVVGTGGRERVATRTKKESDLPTYRVVEYDRVPGIKRSVTVRLQGKVPTDVVRRIAERVYAAEIEKFERTYVQFLLPGMVDGAGAWAVAKFDPDLHVEVLGVSATDEARLAARALPPHSALAGCWLDESPAIAARIAIYKDGGEWWLERVFTNGTGDKKRVRESQGASGRRYDPLDPSPLGNHYVVDATGWLEIRDEDGLIVRAKPFGPGR